MFIKKLSFLESLANFTFSETNYHVHLHPSAPRHLLLPPAHPCQHPAHPPQSGWCNFALIPATSLHPRRSRTLWWTESLLSTRLSSTSSMLAPESAGSTKVPTCLVTLSSLYGTSTTSQCTSICWMVKGAPQKLILQNLFKQTYHPDLLSIYFTYLLLHSTFLSNFAYLILPIWIFCHHPLSFTSHLLNIS